MRLTYESGEMRGAVDVVRVEEYTPRPLAFWDQPYIVALKQRINARTRPTRGANVRRLRERGESLDFIIYRDAIAADIAALAELHITTWNATYNVTRGPTIETRTW